MGRPLRKDVLGTDVIGTFASDTGVRVEFWDGSTNQTDGVIIKQRGSRTFVVCRVGDIGTTTSYFTAKLVDTTPNAAGEMRLMGYVGGNGSAGVPISKITKRVATGFPSSPVLNSASSLWNAEDATASTNHDQVRYTWFLENDSTNDYIVLTAI